MRKLIASRLRATVANEKSKIRYLRITKADTTVLDIPIEEIESVDIIAKIATPDPFNGHEYVDLDLPSGVLWATCNIGATAPEQYGDYFAWGETTPQRGSKATPTLEPADAATIHWGGNWRIPTKEDFQELIDECDWSWTTNYNETGVKGCIVMSRKDMHKHIFLPAAGLRNSMNLTFDGLGGYLWSSSPYENNPNNACYLYFCATMHYWHNHARALDLPIRPVITP